MPIKKNNKAVVSIKRGTTDIIKVYKGSVLKFSKSVTPTTGIYAKYTMTMSSSGLDDVVKLHSELRSYVTAIVVDGTSETVTSTCTVYKNAGTYSVEVYFQDGTDFDAIFASTTSPSVVWYTGRYATWTFTDSNGIPSAYLVNG